MTTILPDFNRATFAPGQAVNNQYFPLTPGTIYLYEGEPAGEEVDEAEEEISRFAVTYETQNVAGIDATVIRETAWAGGFLQEDTDDWFAQDTEGNVWYLGEATTEFVYDDQGNFIGTNNNGAWEAGVNGALPGYIMEAHPQVGSSYYQEFAPNDAAVDQAEVLSLDRTVDTEEFGSFNQVQQTLESTEVSPGVFEYKYYAPGVGLVLVEELDQNLDPELIVELESVTTVNSKFFDRGRGTQADDAIDGNDQSNRLRGLSGNDLLQGLDGDDRLIGDDGNDFLIGGAGKDVLNGDEGEDILVGGAGKDVLKGGADRDQFVFRTLADRGDLINDFAAEDVIILVEIFGTDGYSSANPVKDYLQIEQLGQHTIVSIDADGDAGNNPFALLALLQNTEASSLNASNFVV